MRVWRLETGVQFLVHVRSGCVIDYQISLPVDHQV